MTNKSKSTLISLTSHHVVLQKNDVNVFLDNADSLWESFDKYGIQHGLKTIQFFTVGQGLIDKKAITTKKGETFFYCVPKKPIRFFFSLIKYLKNSPLILINTENFLSFGVGVAAKILGTQVIVFYHNPHNPYASKLPKFMLHFFLRNIADAFFFHSLNMKRDFKRITSKPAYIFKFGYDSILFPFIERTPGKELRVVTVSSIVRWKKIEDIIDGVAASKLKEKIILTIVGEDQDPEHIYLGELKQRLVANNIKFEFTGHVPHSQLRHQYHKADVFVNMRPDEGFARVFLEAMATGLPVVCKKGSVVSERLVKNGNNGFIVDSPQELAVVLDRFAEDEQLRKDLGRQARVWVENEYSKKASYESFARAYDTLLAGAVVENEFYNSKSFKLLRRAKRLLLNQHVDSCNHILVDGKVMHLEQYVLIPYCKGKGLDIGYESNKTHPNAIGVDITPAEVFRKYGSQQDKQSVAEVCTSGDDLHMFETGSMDYIVSRHNLEHYKDPIKTLKEWKRVVRIGGIIGFVVPDDTFCDTLKLDPTHYHAFTPNSFQSLIESIGGLKITRLETCVEDWSFLCVMEKTE
jgi:glycosyltransferase involved in cell wall biosynthesis